MDISNKPTVNKRLEIIRAYGMYADIIRYIIRWKLISKWWWNLDGKPLVGAGNISQVGN